MNVLEIVLTTCIIGMFILSIALIRFVLTSSKSLSDKTNHKRKLVKPSSIDQMLFYEKNPFAWRIGFAYSILGYSNVQIKEFNDALVKIVNAEKKIFESSPNNRLKVIINKFSQSNTSLPQINLYKDLLSSHSIFNESSPEEGLDYILTVEIDNFITETLKSFRQDQIDNLERPTEEPPF